jgi:hypothetical protein
MDCRGFLPDPWVLVPAHSLIILFSNYEEGEGKRHPRGTHNLDEYIEKGQVRRINPFPNDGRINLPICRPEKYLVFQLKFLKVANNFILLLLRIRNHILKFQLERNLINLCKYITICMKETSCL